MPERVSNLNCSLGISTCKQTPQTLYARRAHKSKNYTFMTFWRRFLIFRGTFFDSQEFLATIGILRVARQDRYVRID
jgi:hypothetical protein